jgi:hypothetical protein
MSWLYDRSYVGPDRRSDRQMGLFERRKQNADGSSWPRSIERRRCKHAIAQVWIWRVSNRVEQGHKR